MAQLVERILGKDEVPGSNPGSSSKTNPNRKGWGFWFVLELLLLTLRGFSSFAKKTGSHAPTEDRKACFSGAGSGHLRISEYSGLLVFLIGDVREIQP